jgi:hypothetical protein
MSENKEPEYNGDAYFEVIEHLYEERDAQRVLLFFRAYRSALIPVGKGKHLLPIYFAMIKSKYVEDMTETGQNPHWSLFEGFDIDPMCPFFLASWVVINMHLEPDYDQLRYSKCSSKQVIIDIFDYLKIVDTQNTEKTLDDMVQNILSCLPIPTCRIQFGREVTEKVISKLKEYEIYQVIFNLYHPDAVSPVNIVQVFYDKKARDLEHEKTDAVLLKDLLAKKWIPYCCYWGMFQDNDEAGFVYEWLRRIHSDKQGSYLEVLGDLLE